MMVKEKNNEDEKFILINEIELRAEVEIAKYSRDI